MGSKQLGLEIFKENKEEEEKNKTREATGKKQHIILENDRNDHTFFIAFGQL